MMFPLTPVHYALLASAFCLASGCASAVRSKSPDAERFGVVVMAHGGRPEWNQAVRDAVAPVKDRYPLEIAFGMADATTIQAAIDKLEAAGVRKIAVVRLFVSGESWYERTEQILGLRPGASAAPLATAASTGSHDAGHDAHGHDHHHPHHHDHEMPFFRIETKSRFALSTQGLADEPEMGKILAERARHLSRVPDKEDVLVLAHGPADDDENDRWLARIDARADEIRRVLPLHSVRVETLREDWPDKRAAAEQRIRAFVARAAENGRRVIVIPFRLHGFGPYAEVLDGLEYVADGRGLLPDARVTRWIANQTMALHAGPFRAPLGETKEAKPR